MTKLLKSLFDLDLVTVEMLRTKCKCLEQISDLLDKEDFVLRVCREAGLEFCEKMLDDGVFLKGFMKHGLMQGPGKLVWPDGSYFVGIFKDNQREGYGLLYERFVGAEELVQVYEGSWRQGMRHG